MIGKALSLLKRGFYFVKEAYVDALRFVLNPVEGAKLLYGVSLYRNAVYFMINSGVTVFLGFIFWIVVARLYLASDVGFALALLSAASLLAFIGTFGLGYGIIRFLPHSQDKVRLLNFCFTFVAIATAAAALIFLAGLHFWSPKLLFIRESLVFLGAFVIFVIVASLNGVMTSAFMAFRRAEFILASGLIVGILKLVLVIGFSVVFKVFGIFASWGVAVAVAWLVSIFIFLPRLLPHYRPIPFFRLHSSTIPNPQSPIPTELLRFSFVNYLGDALLSLPGWILPLMVLNTLTPEDNAYFYMAWMMAGLLLVISGATSTSLFAEGSYIEERLSGDLRRGFKLLALLVIPAVVIFVLLGDKFLLLLGREYAVEGAELLWLLALGAIPASVNLLYLGVVQVEKKLKEIILLTGAIAFGTLILSYFLLPWLGIFGAGVGWLMAQTGMALAISYKLVKRLK